LVDVRGFEPLTPCLQIGGRSLYTGYDGLLRR